MTRDEIMQQLQLLGNESTKKVLIKHGAREPFFGVKIEYLKEIVKKTKTNYALSLGLYNTGNSDAMYLAGLMADPEKMTREDLNEWAEKAYWYMLSEYTVAWVASESPYGLELALQWIDSGKENIASSGWATLASIAAIKNDSDIDKKLFIGLLERVSKTIHTEKNRVRHTMNNFVIALGGYCTHLSEDAKHIASTLGKVQVDMGGTACKVPDATEYIKKMHKRNLLGKKRKSARC
ncbi:MAG: DNA alkylation repair protein [Bacteroidota bacterium]